MKTCSIHPSGILLAAFSIAATLTCTARQRLHEDVEDVAVLVDRPPEILLVAVERHEQLIEMPRVSHPTAPSPERAGVARTERQAPLADRLVGDRNAPLGQQVLHIPQAESETVVKPDSVADDLRRESVAMIAWRLAAHPHTLPPAPST